MDDLYKLLNGVSMDEIEFEEMKITQLEKERVKKNLKLSILSSENNLKSSINKKIFMSLASCLAILITIGLFNTSTNTNIVHQSSDNSYSIIVNLNGSNYYFSSYIEENENILGNCIAIVNKKVGVEILPKLNESNYFDSGTKMYKEKNGDGIIAIDKEGQYILLEER